MNILFTHIKELLQTRPKSEVRVVGDAMKTLPHIKNAFLRIQGDTILDFGAMADLVIQETDEVNRHIETTKNEHRVCQIVALYRARI